MPLLLRFLRMIRLRRVRLESVKPAQPRVSDVVVPIVAFALFLVAVILWSQSQSSQLIDVDRKLNSLREQEATLEQQAGASESAVAVGKLELARPHPTIQDRDFQAIGGHANVSWTFD